MAELSDHDKRVLLGEDYKDREVKETPAAQKAAKRASMRNAAIGIAVLAAVVLFFVFYGGGR
jgi:hypothetical protein